MKKTLFALALLALPSSALATTVTCWFPEGGTARAEKVEFFSVRGLVTASPGTLRFTASNGLRHVIVNVPCDVTS